MARKVLQGGDHPVGVRADKLHAPAGGEDRGAVPLVALALAASLSGRGGPRVGSGWVRARAGK